MSEAVILRGLALLACVLPLLLMLQRLWRDLGAGSRLVLGFTLGLYLLTYLAGTALLFLGQEELIDHYFSGAVPAPHATPYGRLLGLAFLPPPMLAIVLWLCRQRGAMPAGKHEDPRDGGWPALIAVLLTLALALLLTGGLIFELVANALTGVAQTEGLTELYARRMAVFESMSALQGGMVYGCIPACAVLLLFQRRPALRLLGLPVAALAVLLNIGLFQIGTLLAFGLTLLMCGLALSTPAQTRRLLAVSALAGLTVFAAYQSLKDEDQVSSPLTQLLLRMPIALPYLWQFSEEAAPDLAASDSLPHDLGEFMFPELRRPERFVAMPQPAFVAAYFQYNLPASLAVLALIGLAVALVGRLLDRLQQRTHRVWIAVAFTPALYYAFQVSLAEVLLSSYGIVFSALPVLATLAARSLTPKRIS